MRTGSRKITSLKSRYIPTFRFWWLSNTFVFYLFANETYLQKQKASLGSPLLIYYLHGGLLDSGIDHIFSSCAGTKLQLNIFIRKMNIHVRCARQFINPTLELAYQILFWMVPLQCFSFLIYLLFQHLDKFKLRAVVLRALWSWAIRARGSVPWMGAIIDQPKRKTDFFSDTQSHTCFCPGEEGIHHSKF